MSLFLSSLRSIHDFWHARTGKEGLRVAGYVRVCYAFLFLADQLLLGVDLHRLLDPFDGMIPYRFAVHQLDEISAKYSVWSLAPESRVLLWFMYLTGLVHGLCLLLGVGYPRLHVLAIFFHHAQFIRHNALIWDGEDVMLRMWSFLLAFLPLHYITVYDGFGYRPNSDPIGSWPMWPFRLWQIYMCLVYMGASLGKLDGPDWVKGDALYWVSYTDDFWGMLFNPDFLFNRLWSLKIMAWSALVIELSCWATIWIRGTTRRVTLCLLILFHLAIDVTMNMHVFEWLTMVGWMVFLVEPLDHRDGPPSKLHSTKNGHTMPNGSVASESSVSIKQNQPPESTKKRAHPEENTGIVRRIFDTILALSLLTCYVTESLPLHRILGCLNLYVSTDNHTFWYDVTNTYVATPIHAVHGRILMYVTLLGIDGGFWDMFDGTPDRQNSRYSASIAFRNGTIANWHSPDWKTMPWYMKKRHLRMMNYYEYIEEHNNARPAHVALCRYLARQYDHDPEANIAQVHLVRHWEEGVVEPASIGSWFIPARQEMEKGTVHLYMMRFGGEDSSYYDDNDEYDYVEADEPKGRIVLTMPEQKQSANPSFLDWTNILGIGIDEDYDGEDEDDDEDEDENVEELEMPERAMDRIVLTMPEQMQSANPSDLDWTNILGVDIDEDHDGDGEDEVDEYEDDEEMEVPDGPSDSIVLTIPEEMQTSKPSDLDWTNMLGVDIDEDHDGDGEDDDGDDEDEEEMEVPFGKQVPQYEDHKEDGEPLQVMYSSATGLDLRDINIDEGHEDTEEEKAVPLRMDATHQDDREEDGVHREDEVQDNQDEDHEKKHMKGSERDAVNGVERVADTLASGNVNIQHEATHMTRPDNNVKTEL